jgi:protein-S-isoprenylcysteine O-methyltransferase Ste14
MSLKDEYERTGNWLFKRRSYLPVLFFCVVLLSLRYFEPLTNKLADAAREFFCLAVSYLGLAVRIFTVGYTPTGTSGRNTRGQVAQTLNTTGMYSIVRHPIYLGNFLMWFGISLFPMLWWLSVLCILIFWVYYERIMFAEEAYLRERFGEDFTVWAEKTPALVPSPRNYVKPDSPFSWKKVLRKEYNGFLATALCFSVMETMGDYFSGTGIELDPMWAIILGLSFAVWLILRLVKHHTSLLAGN